jgi:peptidyl-prolyl cis-trans isomerase B (cyclophilin B)
MKRISMALLAGAIIGGCQSGTEGTGTGTVTTSEPATTSPVQEPDKPKVSGIGSTSDMRSKKPLDGEEVGVIETKFGRIVFRFFEDKAPQNVANIKKLANEGYYNGTKFHRTVKGFMIQGGDPNTKCSNKAIYGSGGPGYTMPDEFSEIGHTRGILSMANTGQPNSGGSQFFIVQGDSYFLDTKYTVFGQVCFDGTERPGAAEPAGLAVVDKIVSQPVDGESAVNPIPITMAIKKWPLK